MTEVDNNKMLTNDNNITSRLRRIAEEAQCDCDICDTVTTAADEIERLRTAGDLLLDRLNDWHNGAPYHLDAEAIKAWREARHG